MLSDQVSDLARLHQAMKDLEAEFPGYKFQCRMQLIVCDKPPVPPSVDRLQSVIEIDMMELSLNPHGALDFLKFRAECCVRQIESERG